jgi:hypothetical protein
MSKVWLHGDRNHAHGCVPLFLRMQQLSCLASAQGRRLLRLLFLWLGQVSFHPTSAWLLCRHRPLNRVLVTCRRNSPRTWRPTRRSTRTSRMRGLRPRAGRRLACFVRPFIPHDVPRSTVARRLRCPVRPLTLGPPGSPATTHAPPCNSRGSHVPYDRLGTELVGYR